MITVVEFKNDLLEMYQSPARVDTLSFKQKRAYLDVIIEENLKLIDAYRKKIDQDPEIKEVVKRYRDRVLMGKFIEIKIVDNLISETELKKFYNTFGGEIRVQHILIRPVGSGPERDKEARQIAEGLLKRARSGEDFAELAVKYSHDSNTAKKGGDLGYFRWGKMGEEFEKVAFAMKPGEVSNPVRSFDGYHIIKLLDKKKRSFEEEKRVIKIQLGARKSEQIHRKIEKYFERLLAEYKARIYFDNLRKFAAMIKSSFNPLENIGEKERGLILASYKGGKVTVGSIIDQGGTAVWIEDTIKQKVLASLKQSLFIDKAIRTGLLEDEEIKKQIRKFKEQQMLKKTETMEVTNRIKVNDEEIKNYFEENAERYKNPERVSIRQIYVRDKRLAQEIAERIKQGEDFLKLANSYDELTQGKDQKEGASEYFEITRYGELSAVIHSLKRGDIAGPIPYNDGYLVIKLLDRQPAESKTLEQARNQIQAVLTAEKTNRRKEEWLRQLREHTQVEIYEGVFTRAFHD